MNYFCLVKRSRKSWSSWSQTIIIIEGQEEEIEQEPNFLSFLFAATLLSRWYYEREKNITLHSYRILFICFASWTHWIATEAVIQVAISCTRSHKYFSCNWDSMLKFIKRWLKRKQKFISQNAQLLKEIFEIFHN